MLDIKTVVYQLPIEVNVDRLINEIENIVIPGTGLTNGDCSITGTDKTDVNHWFTLNRGIMTKMFDPVSGKSILRDFVKYPGTGIPMPWRDDMVAVNSDGSADQDLVHWHPSMISGEIFNLKERIAAYLKIDSSLRCRFSFFNKPKKISRHSDPHTPWRAHINLKSGPGSRWTFFDPDSNESVDWHQPIGTVWLMRTGNIEHAVTVPPGETRWQLFYHIWQKDLGPNYYRYP